jgi:hypothetical protein
MERDGLDAIVAPNNTGHATDWQADARYISGCGGGLNAGIGVVFPLDGDVTVIANAANRWGPSVQNWVHDVREAHRLFGKRLGERLAEMRVDGRRIGVSGLGGGTRSAEGTILHGTYEAIHDAVPNARFVDATELMQEAREVKSAEEIDALRLSVELVEHGVEAQVRWAQPGVPDYVAWAEMLHAMLRRGSELGVHFNWRSGDNPEDTLTRATMRPLARGDIIRSEVEASVIGYRSQQFRPIAVHECPPEMLELSKVHADEFYPRVLEALKAGVTVGELVHTTLGIGRNLAPTRGPLVGMTASMTLHGRGLGDDRPLVLTRRGGASVYQGTDREWNLPFPENGVYICKPTLFTDDGRFGYRWGDTVRTTAKGAVRLGSAAPGMLVSEPADVEWPLTPLVPGPLR